jgi:hypothetical protein
VLSLALLNRTQQVNLKEYAYNDLYEITNNILHNPDRAEELASDFCSAKLFARQHHKTPEPTPRDLFATAKAEA